MQEMVIEAGRTERQYWRDLWRYRELFYFLAWRDLLVRYKQTVVGVGWAVFRPILTMMVLTVVFGRLADVPDYGLPYPLLAFSGMLPWLFFATALTESGNSLVSNSNLISKIYFPRLVVPASSVIASLVDLAISAVLLAILMAWYRQPPPPQVVFLPVFVLMAFAAAFGVGLWVSALMVKYRDFRHILPFATQIGFYISPVPYASKLVPDEWRIWYSLNPMVGVIDGFRWALLGQTQTIYWPGMALSVIMIALLLVTGISYFRSTERSFADVI
jgi:lipopolysaccharide transport system permease protein